MLLKNLKIGDFRELFFEGDFLKYIVNVREKFKNEKKQIGAFDLLMYCIFASDDNFNYYAEKVLKIDINAVDANIKRILKENTLTQDKKNELRFTDDSNVIDVWEIICDNQIIKINEDKISELRGIMNELIIEINNYLKRLPKDYFDV